jgi:citronellol/citronellal dehydrogenase
MSTLKDRTILISGASRGIGLAIALRCARDGANLALLAKTAEPHPKLPGTLPEAAAAVEAAGGRALPILCDIRDGAAVAEAVAQAAAAFGGIDAVVNNASAISLTGTADTPLKRYDLMTGVNSRGTFAVTQAALPWLLKSDRAHILTIWRRRSTCRRNGSPAIPPTASPNTA